jgi:hypothetical protein
MSLDGRSCPAGGITGLKIAAHRQHRPTDHVWTRLRLSRRQVSTRLYPPQNYKFSQFTKVYCAFRIILCLNVAPTVAITPSCRFRRADWLANTPQLSYVIVHGEVRTPLLLRSGVSTLISTTNPCSRDTSSPSPSDHQL